jgi:cell division protease FtsH
LSQILRDVSEEKVSRIEVEGETISAKYKDGEELISSRKEPFDSLVRIMEASDLDPKAVEIVVKDQSMAKAWGSILEFILPVLLMGVIFLFIFRQMRGAQDSVFSFGKNKAKLFMKGKQDVRFKDVGGVDEVKQELEEVVDFLKHPKKYQKLGAKTPKGVLLVGPAGTGKTLLARAVAGEAGVPFLSMAGSEFMEMLVGVGASRVRDLFATAKKSSPSIIFIDEIDAIGRQRGMGVAGGHDEREQTLNQILVEMDGFTPRDNVIILAATNRGDLLDPALLRPGRFDRTVTLDLPDIEGRKHVLGIHKKGKPFVTTVDWGKVARRTVGFSGADIENMLNEAAIGAARNNKNEIDYGDIEEAATKVKLGPQKRRLQSDEEKLMTAYHEAGHAVCAFYMEHTDPVHRISIVSRGHALGFTQIPPEKDKYHETKSELLDMLVMLLGGRAAEELEFKEMTGGAASDISRATMIARRMVMDFGMSSLGPIQFSPQTDTQNYRAAFYKQSELSDKMQAKVDDEINKLLDNAYKLAVKTLRGHKEKLDMISSKLIEVETLEGEDFEELMRK